MTEVSADEQLLHRKHWVNLLYAVVGGLLTAAIIQCYQASAPPQRVVLANADTITRSMRGVDSLTGQYMEAMVDELRRIRENSISQQGRPSALPGTDASVGKFPADVINLPVLNRFALPSSAKGWTVETLNPFAVYRCPPRRVEPKAELELAVSLRNPSLAPSLTPLEFLLNKPETISRTLVVYRQQYEMLPNNRVLFTAPLEPGRYRIEFGFFVKADVSGAYPRQYMASCELVVDSTIS